MVDLGDCTPLKEHTQMPIGGRIPGDRQNPGRLLIQPVTNLRFGKVVTRQQEKINIVDPVGKRCQEGRLVNDDEIIVLVEDERFKIDL
jgi:hypothetical protein